MGSSGGSRGGSSLCGNSLTDLSVVARCPDRATLKFLGDSQLFFARGIIGTLAGNDELNKTR
jgi:hypothetical protein